MADEDLRELERRWAEGQGDLAAGEAFSRALERAGAEVGRRLEVRLQVLRAHISTAGLGRLTLGPQPELDPMAASFLIPGEEALGAWHALRARTEASGAYPVIVGSEEQFERALELINELEDLDPGPIIRGAERALATPPWQSVAWDDGCWPTDPVDQSEPFAAEDAVRVALLPTRTPWHAAAYLRFGIWSNGLAAGLPVHEPRQHAALHRSWYERFGALPLSMLLSRVDFFVSRPPTTREACAQLWAEHATYYAGTGSVHAGPEQHGAKLLGATVWTLQC